jgi:hypothetical protein
MPTPVASSFIKDLQQALIDKVLSDLGVDSTTYPIQRYQQIVFAGRSGGRPALPRVEDQLPAFWVEYLGGGSERTEVGHGRRVPSCAVEVFNCYTVINLTPEIMGCERDDQTFYEAGEAAVDQLMRLVGIHPQAAWRLQCGLYNRAPV